MVFVKRRKREERKKSPRRQRRDGKTRRFFVFPDIAVTRSASRCIFSNRVLPSLFSPDRIRSLSSDSDRRSGSGNEGTQRAAVIVGRALAFERQMALQTPSPFHLFPLSLSTHQKNAEGREKNAANDLDDQVGVDVDHDF